MDKLFLRAIPFLDPEGGGGSGMKTENKNVCREGDRQQQKNVGGREVYKMFRVGREKKIKICGRWSKNFSVPPTANPEDLKWNDLVETILKT